MRDAARLSTRLEGALRDRGILSKLLLLIVTLGGMLIAVEGWETPFPRREGERITHGVVSRLRFVQVDPIATEQIRNEQAKDVPLVFRSESFPVQKLAAQLRSYLQNISSATSYEHLSPDTQAAFQLIIDASSEQSVENQVRSIEQEFNAIKSVLSAAGSSVSARIDEIVTDFESFLAPISELGLADPEEIERQGASPNKSIAILPSNQEETPPLEELKRHVLVVRDILLEQQLETSGRLGRNWVTYPNLQVIRTPLSRWLQSQRTISLHYDSRITQDYREIARRMVEVKGTTHERNSELVPPGNVLDEKQLLLLRAEFDEYAKLVGWQGKVFRSTTVLLMLGVLAVLFGYYLRQQEPELLRHFPRLTIYLMSLVVCVYLSRQLSFDPWRAEVIPLLAITMIVAIAFNQELATITAFLLSLIVTLSTVQDLGHFVTLITVTSTAAICLSEVSSRSTLIKVGFLCGVMHLALTWGVGAIRAQSPLELVSDWQTLQASLRGAGWCLVAGYLVAGSLPFIESSFGVVTDISLLEMSDISHPLLQELVRRAPGTYNHSIAVATIGEAATDAIGGNGLLVRVGAYFHDIGKMIKPEYFIENLRENEKSRHEHLNPAMSTLIIIGHVKDGVDLASQHNLPPAIIDFIEQHHGTTLVEYFYREAEKKADERQSGDVEESAFRYPGPKPQSKEAGVMMLADAVESATRTLVEPTAKRIESLVDKLMMKRLLDGQFDESTLTLTELHVVKESLVKSLIAIYHSRVKYPDQKTA